MIFLHLTMQQRILKNVFFYLANTRKLQIAVIFQASLHHNIQFLNDYNYISFIKLPWPGDREGTFRSSSQAATYLPQYIATN